MLGFARLQLLQQALTEFQMSVLCVDSDTLWMDQLPMQDMYVLGRLLIPKCIMQVAYDLHQSTFLCCTRCIHSHVKFIKKHNNELLIRLPFHISSVQPHKYNVPTNIFFIIEHTKELRYTKFISSWEASLTMLLHFSICRRC